MCFVFFPFYYSCLFLVTAAYREGDDADDVKRYTDTVTVITSKRLGNILFYSNTYNSWRGEKKLHHFIIGAFTQRLGVGISPSAMHSTLVHFFYYVLFSLATPTTLISMLPNRVHIQVKWFKLAKRNVCIFLKFLFFLWWCLFNRIVVGIFQFFFVSFAANEKEERTEIEINTYFFFFNLIHCTLKERRGSARMSAKEEKEKKEKKICTNCCGDGKICFICIYSLCFPLYLTDN